jgi:hypothetical protein
MDAPFDGNAVIDVSTHAIIVPSDRLASAPTGPLPGAGNQVGGKCPNDDTYKSWKLLKYIIHACATHPKSAPADQTIIPINMSYLATIRSRRGRQPCSFPSSATYAADPKHHGRLVRTERPHAPAQINDVLRGSLRPRSTYMTGTLLKLQLARRG